MTENRRHQQVSNQKLDPTLASGCANYIDDVGSKFSELLILLRNEQFLADACEGEVILTHFGSFNSRASISNPERWEVYGGDFGICGPVRKLVFV